MKTNKKLKSCDLNGFRDVGGALGPRGTFVWPAVPKGGKGAGRGGRPEARPEALSISGPIGYSDRPERL